MAVKIVRQPKKIALIGAPSSAAGFAPGTEKAPAAFRAAGLVEKLQAIGYEVTDYGDCAPRIFADDDEHKRARNIPEIVAGLNDLKPRAEIAAKSGALLLVLGGGCVETVAVLAGLRRYYKHLSLLWVDRDADLNTPASTPSGRLDGMALAGIIGKGSPELVRFWGEPPLVREPDTLIYGLVRLDPPEKEFLSRSPMRHLHAADVQAKGAEGAARSALSQLHADVREFVLHVDLDVIAAEEFPAVNVPGNGGLSFGEVRASLAEFAKHNNLLALDIAAYNPEKDGDGSGAKKIVDLLVEALSARFSALSPVAPSTVPATEKPAEPEPQPSPTEPVVPSAEAAPSSEQVPSPPEPAAPSGEPQRSYPEPEPIAEEAAPPAADPESSAPQPEPHPEESSN